MRLGGLFSFRGGIRVRSHKAKLADEPIRGISLGYELVIPLQQHIGKITEPVVEVGQKVLKGEMIAQTSEYVSAPIHAPTSGVIREIGERPVPHPSGLNGVCIVMEPDGEDKWTELTTYANDYNQMDPSHLRNLIRRAGIVGLGGAGFPSFIKLNPGTKKAVDLLIINGAECEPFITCDHLLMRERPGEVISGALLLKHAVNAKACVIAVEDNKPDAVDFLEEAIQPFIADGLTIETIPTRYPAGSEKQIIYSLTGREVPSDGLPLDVGVICQNVGTTSAIYRAVFHGEPLVSRVVTVAGDVERAGNYEVPIGTSIRDILKQVGLPRGFDAIEKIIVGGPMMGYAIRTPDVPIIKTTNCIIVDSGGEKDFLKPSHSLPCIRCGKCAEVCPINLTPQQLYWYSKAKEFEKAQEYSLFDCIECGCCDYVCPSKIPLVQYYRYAKSEIWAHDRETKKSDLARERFEARQARLEREKAEKEERLKKKKQSLTDEPELKTGKVTKTDPKQAAILAAMERVNAKKKQENIAPKNTDNLSPDQQEKIKAIDEARAKNKPHNEGAE